MLFKKMISLSLLFSLFVSSAQANTLTGLKSAVDEFQYSLNVEWDQKDKSVYKKEADKFLAQIEILRAQGLTTQQFTQFMLSEVKDAKLAKELETALMMVEIQDLSSSEASNLVFQTVNQHYSKGSSWNGMASVTKGVLIAGLVGLAIYGLLQLPSGCSQGGEKVACPDDGFKDGPTCDTYCQTNYTNCQQQCFWL